MLVLLRAEKLPTKTTKGDFVLRYSWTLLLVITSIMAAYYSFKSNQDSGKYIWMVFITGFFNNVVWYILTKVSKNMVFDNFLFTLIMCSIFTITFAVCDHTNSFRPINWIGVVAALIGLCLMKV